ncbi:hypothetical protein LVY75_33665 (plasmid) [Sinorhizobium sp. B11]
MLVPNVGRARTGHDNLNDVRIASDGAFAYRFEKEVVIQTDGKPLRRPDGRQPQFNADGIALSRNERTLYF